MGSAGCRYCRRECQSSLGIGRGSSGSWAGDGCEGHRPAHKQVGARWPGAQALEGTSQVIGFVSTAAGLEASFPVLRPLSHVAPLCMPHVEAVTSSDPAQELSLPDWFIASLLLATGWPPRPRSARQKSLSTIVQAKQGVRHAFLSFPRASSSRTNQGARVRVPIAPRFVTSCQVRAVLARVLPRPAHSISPAVSTRA